MVDGEEYSSKFEKAMHRVIKKVSTDIEEMKFNTAISTFMTLVNDFYKEKSINKAEFKTFLQLLNPFAPHMTEELSETVLGGTEMLAYMEWPTYDEEKTIADEITLPIQFNGKLKATITISLDEAEESVKEKVHKAVQDKLENKTIIKEIYVKNKIYNIVVK